MHNSNHILSGSLKANFGHVEGASGVAGILKCILILEKGIIPPNALFERWNPKIKAKFNNLQVSKAMSSPGILFTLPVLNIGLSS